MKTPKQMQIAPVFFVSALELFYGNKLLLPFLPFGFLIGVVSTPPNALASRPEPVHGVDTQQES